MNIYVYALVNVMVEEKLKEEILEKKGIWNLPIYILDNKFASILYSLVDQEKIQKITVENVMEHHQFIDFCVKNEDIQTLLPMQMPTIFENILEVQNWVENSENKVEEKIKKFKNEVEFTLKIDFNDEYDDNNKDKDILFWKKIEINNNEVKKFLENKINDNTHKIGRLMDDFLSFLPKNIISDHIIENSKCIFLIRKKNIKLFEKEINLYFHKFIPKINYTLSGFWAIHHFSQIHYKKNI